MKLEDAVHNVSDYPTLAALLAGHLDWEINAEATQDDVTFDWSGDELKLPKSSAQRLNGGIVRQLRLPVSNAPWGIFFVEFAQRNVYRTVLRQVLRGLVPRRRREANLPAWKHDNLLFICTTADYERFTFAHFSGDKSQTAKLATFGWRRGERHIRTLCEYNLPALRWPENDGQGAEAWVAAWSKAFDKEPLTRDFFKRFDAAIAEVQADLEKHQGFKSPEAYTRSQLLLERMIFLYFLQNRGWLNQQRDYLLSNFRSHRQRPNEFSYYHDFLEKLFWTLSSPKGSGGDRCPGIPFLNGGLFDDDEFAQTPVRRKQNPPLNIRNSTFARVFDEFLEAFNFTVREDTPLNQEVAVDPEMLGKVFESIVLHAEAADPDAIAPDKRKATGSYYTPRIVVHFICQEAIRQYLIARLPGESFTSGLAELMKIDASDGLDAEELRRLRDMIKPDEAAKILPLLAPKCCDPAVGSGAFPVGLLHELVNLRRVVQCVANGYVDPVRKDGREWLHKNKEEIIQDCLYGVDIQQQAIEICRLRLWLSLVVDYDLGVDAFAADATQFREKIDRISQLPNLEMNFRRGDSLHDYISGVPLVVHQQYAHRFTSDIEYIHKKGLQLHRAKKAEQKRKLRLDILERRLEMSRRVLEAELKEWQKEHSLISDTLFSDETATKAEKRKRIEQETERIQSALKKLTDDRKELDRLASRGFDNQFYPKLRRLEGADFDSPFNFAWQIDYADIFADRNGKPVSTILDEFAFVNELDQQASLLDRHEEAGGFDIIVGNPPFVTARNPNKRELYRERWKRVCSGKYQLVCPFFDLSFSVLLRPSGQLGFIVSNAFAKREFGKPLVEDFFSRIDLRNVIDCSGLMFPGHGTPTCIVIGRNQKSNPKTHIRVAATLPGGGDLRTPPEDSPLWQSLAEHFDEPGYTDSRIIVTDRPRNEMAKWPWNLDPGPEPTIEVIESTSTKRLRGFLAEDVGFMFVIGRNDIFMLASDVARRFHLSPDFLKQLNVGDEVRNFEFRGKQIVIFPYDQRTLTLIEFPLNSLEGQYFNLFRKELSDRPTFSGTFADDGRTPYQYHQLPVERAKNPLSIALAQIATHGHFVFDDSGAAFNEKAPLLKLPRNRDSLLHHLLAGLLNSSAALFWLKYKCFNKGAGEDEERDRFEYAGGKVQQLPVPPLIASSIEGKSNPLADKLTKSSRECWERGNVLSSLALKTLFEESAEAYHAWNSRLPGYVEPHKDIARAFTTSDELVEQLARAIKIRETLRSEMVARQEEMDWLAYEAYGLIDVVQAARLRDLVSSAFGNLSDSSQDNASQRLALRREQRPFCLWAAADDDFDRAVASIPDDWTDERKQLWKARLELIRDNAHIRRIEEPVYKRRWDEQWKVGNRWQCGQPAYDQEFIDAFTWWLSEKAEWWLEKKSRAGVATINGWASALWNDSRVQAAWSVAAEVIHRLDLWKREQKSKPTGSLPTLDTTPTAFSRFFKATVKEQTVPEGIPFAVPYEKIRVNVPAQVKKIRGKLNVPRERFRVNEDGLYRVASFDEVGSGGSPSESRPFE
jgi:Eco57I restriction-modification methylase